MEEWLISRPDCFTPGKVPHYLLTGGWVGSRGGSGRFGGEKIFFPPTGIQTPDRAAHILDTNNDYVIPAFAQNGTLI